MKTLLLYPFTLFIILFENIGRYFDLMIKTFRSFRTWPIYLTTLPDHLMILGVSALPIVVLTGLFTGMVTSVQAAYQFESGFIPTWYVGGIVGEAVFLELGPMITGLVMTGRVGATIAAEDPNNLSKLWSEVLDSKLIVENNCLSVVLENANITFVQAKSDYIDLVGIKIKASQKRLNIGKNIKILGLDINFI